MKTCSYFQVLFLIFFIQKPFFVFILQLFVVINIAFLFLKAVL